MWGVQPPCLQPIADTYLLVGSCCVSGPGSGAPGGWGVGEGLAPEPTLALDAADKLQSLSEGNRCPAPPGHHFSVRGHQALCSAQPCREGWRQAGHGLGVVIRPLVGVSE